MSTKIIDLRNNNKYQLFEEGYEFKIGRSNHCQIGLPDGHISKNHCVIIKRKDDYILKALKTINPTLVNEVRVMIEMVLKDGDIINICGYQFIFSSDNPKCQRPCGELPDVSDLEITNTMTFKFKGKKKKIGTRGWLLIWLTLGVALASGFLWLILSQSGKIA